MGAVIVNGFFVGLVYGLVAVGVVVVYRGSRVINFAQGETGMVAAMVFADLRFGTNAATLGDHGLLVALPAALLLGAVIGGATEFFVARPLRQTNRVQVLVATFAVAALLLTFAVSRWETSVRFTKPLVEGDGVRIAGFQVAPGQLLILIVSVITLAGLWFVYRYTAFGLRLRATALDPYAAMLTGVNVNRTSVATWALAGALAAMAAVLVAPLVAFDVFFMTRLGVRGLVAALVGGLTNIWGAFAAAVLIAIGEGIIAFKSPVSGVADALMVGLILVLVFVRPEGLVRSAY